MNGDLFGTPKMQMTESILIAAQNLQTYGSRYQHWVIAFSGGKDSSATVTLTLWLVGLAWQLQHDDPGYPVNDDLRAVLLELRCPSSITVLYADTRAEILPLHLAALGIGNDIDELGRQWTEEGRGISVRFQSVMAPIDKRMLVYILGRGVPPPNNNTMRYCTRQIKIEPMARAIEQIAIELGYGRMVTRGKGQDNPISVGLTEALQEQGGEIETPETRREIYRSYDQDLLEQDSVWPVLQRQLKKAVLQEDREHLQRGIAKRERELLQHPRKLLVLTGVRRGESVVREQRIVVSCTTDKAECGQGWFQRDLPSAVSDTYAPIDHFRICHVWQWLWTWAPEWQYGQWETRAIAEAYGGRDGDEAAEIAARTGCNGCPLAGEDQPAMRRVVAMPDWSYMAPLLNLWSLYWEMREPRYRLRKADRERLRNGGFSKNAQRMGPLTLEARLAFLERILAIQTAINTEARRQRRPEIDMLNAEEEARIRELIADGTWPDGWTGEEPRADVPIDMIFSDGSVQPLLFKV